MKGHSEWQGNPLLSLLLQNKDWHVPSLLKAEVDVTHISHFRFCKIKKAFLFPYSTPARPLCQTEPRHVSTSFSFSHWLLTWGKSMHKWHSQNKITTGLCKNRYMPEITILIYITFSYHTLAHIIMTLLLFSESTSTKCNLFLYLTF